MESDALTPLAAAVMGTGIVSIAFKLGGVAAVSLPLLWIAVALLGALVIAAALAGAAESRDAARASPQAPTLVAAPCVVGSRLTLGGAPGAGAALLAIAAALAVAIWPIPATRSDRTGSAFLAAVAAFALSALASLVAAGYDAPWLVVPALALVLSGGLLYADAVRRFDRREHLVGTGDHWIAGGAMALAALAIALAREAVGSGALGGLAGPLGTLDWVLWALAIARLVVLVAVEAIRPRGWTDPRRWASVFPLGMYSAASFAVGTIEHAGGLASFAGAWKWVALAAWSLAVLGSLRSMPADRRAQGSTRRRG